jgi:hypothetical protein
MATITTPEFRVSYPNVFKAKKNIMSGKDEFSMVALFPKNADLSKLKAAAEAAIVQEFGADKAKWPKKLRSPFRDQAEKEKDGQLPMGHEAGAIFLNLKSMQRPGVVGPDVQPIMDESQVYAGCFGRAAISVYCYNQAGNVGVAFGLQHFQKTKDGEPLGGRVRVEDAFQPVEGSGGGTAGDLFG